jgi:hypothetical protein
MPQWTAFQKGVEALAASVASIQNQLDHPNKAMTLGDLLVKPMQRVCKYPLLFTELWKVTPVYDCPDSHAEIENVLVRLRETTTDINRATDDPHMKVILERTWLLQDRLTLLGQSGSASKSFARSLGHIHLCGVLHVAWQTKDGVDGQYMVCLLYREYLLLASATRSTDISYKIQACIALDELKIEEVDNGRGDQEHSAAYAYNSRVNMP